MKRLSVKLILISLLLFSLLGAQIALACSVIGPQMTIYCTEDDWETALTISEYGAHIGEREFRWEQPSARPDGADFDLVFELFPIAQMSAAFANSCPQVDENAVATLLAEIEEPWTGPGAVRYPDIYLHTTEKEAEFEAVNQDPLTCNIILYERSGEWLIRHGSDTKSHCATFTDYTGPCGGTTSATIRPLFLMTQLTNYDSSGAGIYIVGLLLALVVGISLGWIYLKRLDRTPSNLQILYALLMLLLFFVSLRTGLFLLALGLLVAQFLVGRRTTHRYLLYLLIIVFALIVVAIPFLTMWGGEIMLFATLTFLILAVIARFNPAPPPANLPAGEI